MPTDTLPAGDTPTCTPTPVGPIIITIAGNGTWGYTGDGGPATSAELNGPLGVVVDLMGNLYIADSFNSVIRKIDTSGIITTVAGIGTSGYSGDGGLATSAQISSPWGITFDSSGNFYFTDSNSVIRKIDTSGIITTVAGNGTQGYSGDGGPATSAQLFGPEAVAIDASGNLYISDMGNNVIRKVDTSGIITTVAGTWSLYGGYSGDGGPAISAELNAPWGIAFGSSGNLYIADAFNNVIRKVDTSGIITTVVGNGTAGYSGDGGPAISALLSGPVGVAFDPSGNLYIVDTGNDVIRKVDTGGIITTVAGNGTWGFSGDWGPPTLAQLAEPNGMAVDSSGNLYIADFSNSRIRKVY